MTRIPITLLLLFCCSTISAQPKKVTEGYVEYYVIYSSKSFDDLLPPPPPPPPVPGMGSEDKVFIGEEGTKVMIWFKPGYEKAVNERYGRITFLFNTSKQSTSILTEIDGKKTGTTASDKEQEEVDNYLDSLHGRKRESWFVKRTANSEEIKIINGHHCLKTIIVSETVNAVQDTTIVWYDPDIWLPKDFIFFTDNTDYKARLSILNRVPGLPVKVDIALTPKVRASIELKQFMEGNKLPDKAYTVPKDFALKPLKEQYGLH